VSSSLSRRPALAVLAFALLAVLVLVVLVVDHRSA